MKIYTKTGDKGETALIGGSRVSKCHPRLESYGSIDELNAFVGLLFDTCFNDLVRNQLKLIQNSLFSIGSNLALEPDETKHKYKISKLPSIKDSDISEIESWIDLLGEKLPPLNGFILPGGHIVVSYSHIVRTICRRAERNIVALASTSEIDELLIIYINRLSDYFFILARYFSFTNNVEEIIWQPKR